jgi:uncharacterized repeat protein (TIGR03809 family)
MTSQLDAAKGRDIVARWCALAERRLEYLTEMFETGRWRRFHDEVAFLENISEAKTVVEAWRDLLSREASHDNRSIDLSWLGRRDPVTPQRERWRDPVHLAKAAEIVRAQIARAEITRAEIAIKAGKRESIVPDDHAAGKTDALSVPPRDEGATATVSDLTTVARRYPQLHNVL